MLEGNHMIAVWTNWIRWQSKAEQVADGWTKLSFPFLDRHNDALQVHVKQDPQTGLYRITDHGSTVRDIKHLVDFEYRVAAQAILRGFGLDEAIGEHGEIRTDTTVDRFPQALNMVLLAILAIDAMGN